VHYSTKLRHGGNKDEQGEADSMGQTQPMRRRGRPRSDRKVRVHAKLNDFDYINYCLTALC